MLTPSSTSPDWQKHPTQIVVLPIGAFEQHSHHLPLDTDIRIVERYAAIVAEELGAALLPCLPFGTSLEQKGFRGTITLRPATLMGVVRDIATDLEEQNFRTLIVLNGHGGNYSLGPEVREWNRADRPLKIILANYWESVDPALLAGASNDIHSGDFETSLMMALEPDHVRHEEIAASAVRPKDDGAVPLRQSDLNTFGFGYFSPTGAVGDASAATRAKGEAFAASIRTNLLALLRDRLARLQRQPRYSGAGGLAIRPLTANDMDAALRLKSLAGWNQTARDWEIFLQAGEIVAAVHNGHVVGTAATIRFENEIAWIGLVLVDPEMRRMGIGKLLLNTALESLDDVPVVGLDATPAGKQLYDTLGFTDECTLQRWVCPAVPAPEGEPAPGLRRATPADLDTIIALDAATFGPSRREFLRLLLESAPEAWVREDAGRVTAFCLGRAGSNFYYAGPVIAPGFAEARALLEAVFRARAGGPVMLDVPDAQPQLIAWLRSLGFTSQRPLIRMKRGPWAAPDASTLFAIAGPEFG